MVKSSLRSLGIIGWFKANAKLLVSVGTILVSVISVITWIRATQSAQNDKLITFAAQKAVSADKLDDLKGDIDQLKTWREDDLKFMFAIQAGCHK